MVGQLKEDVAEWYQGLSAHMRIEAMCTLIDLSMPFEIRFLGSLIEHLGRKDFGSLRDAEAKANSFGNANPDDKKKLLKSLGEVTTGAMVNGTQYANPLMHPGNFNESSPANRPSPTHSVDGKGRLTGSNADTFHGCDHNDHSLCNEPSSNSHDCVGPKGNSKGASSVSNHIGCSSEEETESMCIANDHKRRKLILYISVLAPTNHDGANLYYTVLSDIEDSPALAWLEELDKDAQEEVSLLYTLASRHPAFTFEQRMFLATVANRVNEIISSKYSSRGNTTPLQTAQTHQHPPGTYPIYYNHAALPQMDPKYASYYFVAHPSMHIQQSPHQPSVSSNGEQLRSTAVTNPFPAYASFGHYIFSPHHHPAALQHPTAINPHFAPIPIPSTASPVTPNSQNVQPPGAPVVACSNNSGAAVTPGNSVPVVPTNNNNNHLSASKSQNSMPTAHVSPPIVTNSVSQPSCLSTPSRTSSVPFQSEANSVDGDSESSENCDWNSPESSPFESPPQSLTPSRSQSPPSGVPNSTTVQSVSLSGHSSTFLVTSNGGTFVGPVVSASSSNSSSSSTIVKTEIHTNSGLVITTATSSSTSCSTSSSNSNNPSGGASGSLNTNFNNFSSSNNNNSVNATKSVSNTNNICVHHHIQPTTSQTPHLPPTSTTVRGGGQMKNSNSSQSFANLPPPNAVISSTVISVSQQQQQQPLPPQTLPQQMMGPSVPVHMQQTSVLTSVNNAGGIVSHSMSTANPPLHVAFAQQTPHGAHNNLGLNNSMPPPSQNSYPCFPHMNAVSFGGMNTAAAYRAPSQGVLTRNPYVQPPHTVTAATNALLNSQIAMNKANDVQRGINVHGSLRQKAPLQNTPKRRNNVSSGGGGGGGLVNMPSGIVGPPLQNNSQSTTGKGDEVSESSKDNSRTNEIVVSANPSNNKPQPTDRTTGGTGCGGGKPYHQLVTNGLVNALSSASAGAGGVLPNSSLPNISANNSGSVAAPIPQPQAPVALNSSTNPGGQLIQTATAKAGEDGLLGDGGAVMDNYLVNQLPYHINGPQIFGHPAAAAAPYIQLPNGYMPSFNYPSPSNMAAAVATMGGGPHVPPSTDIMMNPAGVPHFTFPFTIPQSFSSPGSKGITNAKDSSNKSSNMHGSTSGGGGGVNSSNPVSNAGSSGDSSSKVIVSNQLENHGGPPPSAYQVGYYTAVPRTPSQPNRNNRGVILDIGGSGALGNNSLSPVNVDLAVMPPLDELVDTLHRPKRVSCYNCGENTHLGPDCKQGSMESMTRHQFRVNYSGPSTTVTADGKDDGD